MTASRATVLPRAKLPLAVQALNRAGDAARALGVAAAELEPEVLIADARRLARLEDFGDARFREPLEILLRSMDREAGLHFLGRVHVRRMVTAALVLRLRLAEARARRPELDQLPLLPPLIVCGLPRSGTTLLHRMLSEAPDARPLCLWELMEPIPPPSGPDHRRRDAARKLERLRRFAPVSVDAQHYVRPELPDECSHLFKASFLSSMFWQAPAYEYLEYFSAQDLAHAYRDYRAFLALLQDDPRRRFTLKDPFHAANLPALLAVLPQAAIVQTHRDPVETVPSFHKLTFTMHSVLTERLDAARMAEANTRWLERVAQRNLEARAALPPGRIFDVDYRELVRDPVGIVRRVHEYFDLGWSPELQQKLTAFAADNAQRKHGENIYSPELFDQSSAVLAERFAAYRARWRWPS